jgi:hypothetical protein
MPHGQLTRFVLAACSSLAFVGCSESSPVALDHPQYAITLARPAEGAVYLITTHPTQFGRGVVLDAYVEDASNTPATGGTATFQMCALQRIPAPSAECSSGSGSWVRVGSAGIIHTDPPGSNEGHALFTPDFLAPPSGTTIGFRFKYIGQGTGITNSLSGNTADYTWP